MLKLLGFISLLVFSQLSFATPSELTLNECYLDNIKSLVKCGTLSVPENYQQADSQKIDINVAVLPAIDNSQNKTPLMFLAGGPGQAAVELASQILQMFPEIHKTHDIILVDQRGTGKSNAITCDDVESADIYQMSFEDTDLEDVNKCISAFTGDLSQYNSENSIRDFDQVRQALGHEKIHVYGGSYGTRAALVYLRLFPQHLKSVVLDSVGPIEVPIGLFGQSAARSFQSILTNCTKNAPCSSAFPNLAQEFNEVITRLKTNKVTIDIPHPRLGTPTSFVIDESRFISVLRMQLYSLPMRTMVPLIIHQAYLNNYLPLAGLVAQQDGGMGMYMGLTFNIVCNEDYPRVNKQMMATDADNSFGASNSHESWKLICPVWPTYRPSAEFYQAVTAEVPTLILSGDLDPVTPPSNGDFPAKTLPNSAHYVAKNAAHIVAGNGCASDLIAEFLTTLDAKALDATCLNELDDETFMTSLNGDI